MPPRQVGPYRIEVALGRGGVGTVYRAKDRRDGRAVALKMLSMGTALEPMAAKRLAIEFEALAELSHPNIVRVLDAGVHEGYPYLAMELVDGLDLRAWLSIDPDDGEARAAAATEQLRHLVRSSHHGGEDEDSKAWHDADESEESSDSVGGEWGETPFGLDALGADEDSHDAFSDSDRGLRELRALAWQADEPDTEDVVHDFERSSSSLHEARREAEAPRPKRKIDFAMLNRPARFARMRDAAVQLCDALAYIHGRGLVHRDVKPANILVDGAQRVRLMDFGLAKFLARAEFEVTQAGRIVGTYRYVAPELLRREPVDGRADLYAVGVTLYELCCGEPPFDAANPTDLWRQVLDTEPRPLLSLNRGVDPGLAIIVHRLLRKDPEERYQTAEEVAEALLDV